MNLLLIINNVNVKLSGISMNVNLKNTDLVGDLLKLFQYIVLLENYSDELLSNIKRCKLFTRDRIEMDINKQINEYFTNDHILDIYDKGENIFYAIMI